MPTTPSRVGHEPDPRARPTVGPSARPVRRDPDVRRADPRRAAATVTARPEVVEDRVRELRQVTPTRSSVDGYRLNLLIPTIAPAGTFGGIRTALDLFDAIASGGAGPPDRDDDPVARRRRERGAGLSSGDRDRRLGRPGPARIDRPGDRHEPGHRTARRVRRDVLDDGRARRSTPPLAGDDLRPGAGALGVRHPGLRARLLPDVRPVGARPRDVLAARPDGRDLQHQPARGGTSTRTASGSSTSSPSSPGSPEPLRAALAVPAGPRRRTIVVYGRPRTPRNAFPAIVDGLRAWRASDPEGGDVVGGLGREAASPTSTSVAASGFGRSASSTSTRTPRSSASRRSGSR